MSEFFSYIFIQNAILSALLVSGICGIIGSLIVANRLVFASGGIAHSVYGGVGLAAVLGLPVSLGAALFAVFCAVALAYTLQKAKERIDAIIGALWAFGMALGVVLVERVPGFSRDFMGFLFGSILSVRGVDLAVCACFLGVLVLFLAKFYRIVLAISFDSDFAAVCGLKVGFWRCLVLIFVALAIVCAMQSVGIILVIALLSLPAFTAELFVRTLLAQMILSSAICAFCSLLGIVLSYFLDLQSGAAIVLCLSSFCALAMFVRYFIMCRK